MFSSFADTLGKLSERIAVPGLIRYVALLNALVFILHLLAPGYTSALQLDPQLVLEGQVWRLMTWIFIPETLNPFWIFFSLLFLLYLGDGLEHAVGPAKLTRFYISGILLCTAACFLFFAFGKISGGGMLARANTFLNLSLMLAFATAYPDFRILAFFFIPMRISWLALLSAGLMILSSLGQPPVVAATLGAALLNYFLFFGSDLRANLGWIRLRGSAAKPSGQITASTVNPPAVDFLHRCERCGRTDSTHPDLEFRVTSSGAEYCREHLPGAQR